MRAAEQTVPKPDYPGNHLSAAHNLPHGKLLVLGGGCLDSFFFTPDALSLILRPLLHSIGSLLYAQLSGRGQIPRQRHQPALQKVTV